MDTILNIIKNSKNKYEVLKKIGWDTRTVGYRKLYRYIKENNIDISHFETRKEQIKRQKLVFINKIPLTEILISGSTYTNTHSLKNRLYSNGLKERKCELCGQDEIWHGNKMSLILDHINGIHNDHRYENIRIVCPNCNATLPTHCGKNSKRIKKEKLKKIRNVVKISKNLRKTNRPPHIILINDINNLGYCGTGRKYGVSDNSIRKWIQFYEKHE